MSDLTVQVETRYLADESGDQRYVFSYTITIENHGASAAQLLNRHWIITDADGEVQEVRGEGVIGEQPVIAPGGTFSYTSGATLPTPVGCMEGSYFMVVREPVDVDPAQLPTFEVPIPAFSLHTPTALH